jgi:hypothetical protein
LDYLKHKIENKLFEEVKKWKYWLLEELQVELLQLQN